MLGHILQAVGLVALVLCISCMGAVMFFVTEFVHKVRKFARKVQSAKQSK